ncbi:MAG TPA: GNAT family N-acetyltransferase, partial [Chitinophagaceae bacterium]
GRQWKLITRGQIACVWAVTFNDKEIWEEKEKNDAIYLHRIAVNPSFRGSRFIDVIVGWAKAYALGLEKKYVRLDTLGQNTGLIKHYSSAGFTFLGMFQLKNVDSLPEHYHRERNSCLLFEIAIA